MAKKSTPKGAGAIRVKLLAADLAEGAAETIVCVSDERAEELLSLQQARRATIDDFTFDKQAA